MKLLQERLGVPESVNFCKVISEPASGKSSLCYMLILELLRAGKKVTYYSDEIRFVKLYNIFVDQFWVPRKLFAKCFNFNLPAEHAAGSHVFVDCGITSNLPDLETLKLNANFIVITCQAARRTEDTEDNEDDNDTTRQVLRLTRVETFVKVRSKQSGLSFIFDPMTLKVVG